MRTSKMLYFTILLLVLLSAFLAVWVYDLKEGKDLLSFTISTVSFCIAVLALFITVRTYTSIDSVNNISKMEGNILDNENYVTSLPELINQFKSQDENTLEKEIFDSIEHKLKKESETAVLFADTLQYIIDLIVLFPAVFNASETNKVLYKKRMDTILSEVDRRCEILHSVSKGNSIQITETIKLFKAVVSYQSFVADDNFNIHADLLHVRGPILRNPVTKTIYHNYLGLYYNKKGMHLLRESLNMNSVDILSIDGLELAQKNINTIEPSILEEVSMYLKSAAEQFDKALKVSSEDVMWPGFINYNKARTVYFLSLLSNTKLNWLDILDEAIESRSRLNRLIDEILMIDRSKPANIVSTHLREFFLYQEELARTVKLNILLSNNLTRQNNASIIYKGINISDISNEKLTELFVSIQKFSTVSIYQEKIISRLKNNLAVTS
ncbi:MULTISPECIES: hypothetical protein [unclassified Pseudoalteromonas]|uniref:hypothetical protein n=1 Tax=unclassified Pseudoalteromonas TaxID=194690 RepID=UPI0018CD00A3|nr:MULTISPECIES: hypothetical protein [unclassified Pseudoalteromonas]MBH0015689.1 hypothetical protein [Pseudoalteromonas sp. NGC95]MDN3389566.1 hypothetical protein [Pseudoalteromonas sp. APC 3691]